MWLLPLQEHPSVTPTLRALGEDPRSRLSVFGPYEVNTQTVIHHGNQRNYAKNFEDSPISALFRGMLRRTGGEYVRLHPHSPVR
jgi:hypothetical protein